MTNKGTMPNKLCQWTTKWLHSRGGI